MISFAKSKPKKECVLCGVSFEKPYFTCKKKWEKRRFCSKSCSAKTRTGNIPWNKGVKWIEMRKEGNGNWKGDKVGYYGIHKWLERNFVKSGICKKCNETKKTVWANISGVYFRNDDDWIELCWKCHWHFDRDNPRPYHRFKNEKGFRKREKKNIITK